MRLEPCVALEVNTNGLAHGLTDVGDGDAGGVHPFGEAMTE